MRTRFFRATILLTVLAAMLSTGLIAAKARLAPHQLTIFFTGDEWGKYKYCT